MTGLLKVVGQGVTEVRATCNGDDEDRMHVVKNSCGEMRFSFFKKGEEDGERTVYIGTDDLKEFLEALAQLEYVR